MFELNGKVAAVTGAASGIGEAIAGAFAAAGATVYVLDRDREKGPLVAKALSEGGARRPFCRWMSRTKRAATRQRNRSSRRKASATSS
jgi:NAD(P)-dependent dehydrogenase (short-subunit alcohol dehydrogenase family)